jgi:hypothetical protein
MPWLWQAREEPAVPAPHEEEVQRAAHDLGRARSAEHTWWHHEPQAASFGRKCRDRRMDGLWSRHHRTSARAGKRATIPQPIRYQRPGFATDGVPPTTEVAALTRDLARQRRSWVSGGGCGGKADRWRPSSAPSRRVSASGIGSVRSAASSRHGLGRGPRDRKAIERRLREYLANWRGLLEKQIGEARHVPGALLTDRLVFTPTTDANGVACYLVRGAFALGAFSAGFSVHKVVRPQRKSRVQRRSFAGGGRRRRSEGGVIAGPRAAARHAEQSYPPRRRGKRRERLRMIAERTYRTWAMLTFLVVTALIVWMSGGPRPAF